MGEIKGIGQRTLWCQNMSKHYPFKILALFFIKESWVGGLFARRFVYEAEQA